MGSTYYNWNYSNPYLRGAGYTYGNNNSSSSSNGNSLAGAIGQGAGILGGSYLGGQILGGSAAAGATGFTGLTTATEATQAAWNAAALGNAAGAGAGAGTAGAAAGSTAGEAAAGAAVLPVALPIIAASILYGANWEDHIHDVWNGDSTKAQRWDTAGDITGVTLLPNAISHWFGGDTIGETLFGRSIRKERIKNVENFLEGRSDTASEDLHLHGDNLLYYGDTLDLPEGFYLNEKDAKDLDDMVANNDYHERWQYDWTDPYTKEYINQAAPLNMIYKAASGAENDEEQFAGAYLANRLSELREQGVDTDSWLKDYYLNNFADSPEGIIAMLGEAYNKAADEDKWEYLAAQNAINQLYGLDAYADGKEHNNEVDASHLDDYEAYKEAQRLLGNENPV